MTCVNRKFAIIFLLISSLSGFASHGLADELFVDSVLELPFRDVKKSVHSLMTEEISGASLLGISPIKGHKVDPEQDRNSCSECVSHNLSALQDETIQFEKIGQVIDLKSWLSGKSQIFIRDENVAGWDDDQKALRAKSFGSTELYVVVNGEMSIAKIQVGHEDDLAFDQAIAKSKQIIVKVSEGGLARISQPYNAKTIAPSVRDAEEFGGETLDPTIITLNKKTEDLVFKRVAIQLIDQFSRVELGQKKILSGVEVSLVGSDFRASSDSRGIVEISDIPAGSRFFAKIHDKHGRVRNQLVEIATEKSPQDELFSVRTMNDRVFNLYTNTVGVTQIANLSSICLRVMTADGLELLEGLQVKIKNEISGREGDGPYYFNSLAPSLELDRTSANGRFCYFNLVPGLVEMEFFADDEFISTAVIPVGVASHLEDDIYLTNGHEVVTKTVALPSVTDLIYRDGEIKRQYHQVDYLELNTVGEYESMEYVAPGVLRLEPGFTFYRGRMYGLSDTGDFEPALFSYDAVTDSEEGQYYKVTTLLQAGFIEDLFNLLYQEDGMAGVAYNPEMGKVLVHHGIEPGIDPRSLNFKLVNQFGVEPQQGWFFGTVDDGFIKVIFFNVDPGLYTLVVETEENHWLDTTTVPVDAHLTSIVQTGNNLEPRR